jgi:long-chain acyl-CoA synthetase
VNLASLLLEHPYRDGAGLIHTMEQTVTAGEAKAATRQIASTLGDMTGRAVAVQLPNGAALVSTMAGVWAAGGLYVPINPRHPAAEVASVLDALRPAAIITEAGIERLNQPAQTDTGVAFVLWTSGTTGAPKPIFHTHDAYLELLDRVLGPLRGNAAAARSDKRPTPNLIPVSMALNAGLYNTLFGLRAGAELVIMDRFDPHVFAELVHRFDIRSTVLPPAAITMLNESDVTDLGPLKYVRSITAPLSPLQARRFCAKYAVHVLNSYGQAELGEVIGWTAADARAHPEKVGAIGRPHPGVDLRLADDGRLLVRPPNKAKGLEDRTDDEGFVDTGDFARIDEDGFVWIEGRATDLINRGGNKVFPDAVEEVLRLSDHVDDVAVVGAPDDRLGEVPIAFVVGTRVPDEQLVALCREHLVAYKVPVAFHWIAEIPRNETGKVLRRELHAIS